MLRLLDFFYDCIVLWLKGLQWLWWCLLRAVPMRQGLVLTSMFLARGCKLLFSGDGHGAAALAGALAVLARHRHDERLASEVERVLGLDHALLPSKAVAAGLLAASRGHRDAARDLLIAALQFESADRPGTAARIATEWLVADAAARGDWAMVMRMGVRPGLSTAQTRFLAFAAARIRSQPLVDEPSATDVGLRWLWLCSPDRRRNRWLLDHALATPRVLHYRWPGKAARPAEPELPAIDPSQFAGDPIAYAQALHVHLIAQTNPAIKPTPSELVTLAQAWDAAFAGPVAGHLGLRCRALAAPQTGAQATQQVRAVVCEELAAVASRAEIPLTVLSESGDVGEQAASLLRSELLVAVETRVRELRQRTLNRQSLPAIEELRSWNELRRHYDRAVAMGGLHLRQLVFPDVHLNVGNYAVWLWNDRKEYALARPLFRWLLGEAEAVGDLDAIALQRKNVGTS